MKAKIRLEPVRGFRDLVPPESEELTLLMERFYKIAILHGYREVKPPTLERFEVFAIKSGEEIRRSMFVFKDKAGREVALRPEATASIARIYLKALRASPKPLRLFYIVNCFRYEEPQQARYREFWQAGIELLGDPSPLADIEVIKLLIKFYEEIGLDRNIVLKIGNTRLYRTLFEEHGINEQLQDNILHLMDKGMYEEALKKLTFKPKLAQLLKRLWNEARDDLKVARDILFNLLQENGSKSIRAIEELNFIFNAIRNYKPNIKIELDIAFARGLAYYTGVIFEIKMPGFPVSIAGGGRYDKLIELYGGENIPGTGFAIGLDRTLAAMNYLGISLETPTERLKKVAIIVLEENLIPIALKVQDTLLSKGLISTIMPTQKLSRTLSKIAQQEFNYAVIIGKKEVEKESIVIKDLARKTQTRVPLKTLSEIELEAI